MIWYRCCPSRATSLKQQIGRQQGESTAARETLKYAKNAHGLVYQYEKAGYSPELYEAQTAPLDALLQ